MTPVFFAVLDTLVSALAEIFLQRRTSTTLGRSRGENGKLPNCSLKPLSMARMFYDLSR